MPQGGANSDASCSASSQAGLRNAATYFARPRWLDRHPFVVSRDQRYYALNFFADAFGLSELGKHSPHEIFREHSNMSAPLQIRLKPT